LKAARVKRTTSRSGQHDKRAAFAVALGLTLLAGTANADPIHVVVHASQYGPAVARELSVRLPEARVTIEAHPSAFGVVLRSLRPGAMELRVLAESGQLIAEYELGWTDPTMGVREAALLAEGAIRLHLRRLEEMLARIAADVPRFAAAIHAGLRSWPSATEGSLHAELSFRVRYAPRVTATISAGGVFPRRGSESPVDYDLYLVGGRVSSSYAMPAGGSILHLGLGIDALVVLGDFALPNEDRLETRLYLAPSAGLEVEWPRDGRLRAVGLLRSGYAISHPVFRYEGVNVVTLTPWFTDVDLGLRWMF